MNSEQLKLLSRMKDLIIRGKRRFSSRRDRNYIEDLTELGINEEEAWDIICHLNVNLYFPDPKPIYSKSNDVLVFKREVNGVMAYIKLIIQYVDGEEVVCLSFHRDGKLVSKNV